jgi:5,10-methylenetetrahydrofolate reductase
MSPRARSIESRRRKRKREAAEAAAREAAAALAYEAAHGPVGLLPVPERVGDEGVLAPRGLSAAEGRRAAPERPGGPSASTAHPSSTSTITVGLTLEGDPRCPKRMVHGPCGGVHADGTCEIGGPCAFVGPKAAAVPAVAAALRAPLSPAAEQLRALVQRRPIVVADLPSAGPDAVLERRLAAALAGHVDAALLGDSPWARLQFPPAVRASLVLAEGLRPWSGINCRDRNRVALQAELAALRATGVGAIHCVTGDHPRIGATGPVPPGIFDLDSTQLTTLAAQTGAVVSVAESPSAPPVTGRPLRAAAKANAGASIVFVNHAGSHGELVEFVDRTRELAPELRIVVCVPMVLSRGGADRLATFLPGPLPKSVTEVLDAHDPVATAISSAVRVATAALEIEGVDGVDLSAPPAAGEELAVAEALASVGRVLGGGS